ncbi:MAG TPA: ribonuclease domain-containing protein [Pseudonocardiaceae bacterium]|jgi:ribonuclease T1|nr:ribonuclease domain-containing protein [Pseudonocardiaceae bacterium]
MSNLTTRIAKSLLAVVFALAGAYGLAAPATAAPAPAPAAVAPAQASCGDTSGFQQVALSSLPSQATDTVNLIKAGGPYPYPEDGEVFDNRESILPACDSGYYHEYTVDTPGSPTRGTRRIITGQSGEYFYTDDHYASFKLVDINS